MAILRPRRVLRVFVVTLLFPQKSQVAFSFPAWLDRSLRNTVVWVSSDLLREFP